jgi:cob(I)alamin adenosyltransferase
VTRLERELDALNEPLAPLTSFILAGGGPIGAPPTSRAPSVAGPSATPSPSPRHEPVRPQALRYLNRLSDYLFVIARAAAHRLGYPEVLWDARRRVLKKPPAGSGPA